MAKSAQAATTATIAPDDLDQTDAAARATVESDTALEQAAIAADVESEHGAAYTTSEGRRVSRALTTKMLLPDIGWIMREVVTPATQPGGNPRLLKMVGRIAGIAGSYDRRTNKIVSNGQSREVESIALKGMFQGETLNGEIFEVSLLFLPMAQAEQVALALDMGANNVQLDIDIGVQATGKAIPYEWTVTSYLDGAPQRALRRIMANRRIGEAPKMIGTRPQLALSAVPAPTADKPQDGNAA